MLNAESSWDIRPYTAADQPGVEDLLDADADPLWVAQGHRLHGEAGDGDRWRRTLIAERAGRVVGAVTIARNRVHPGRYNLAVEVEAASRRRGLARTLIEQARLQAPQPLPMAGKLRPSDPAGVALLRSIGGRTYQRCPGLCPDPTAPEVRAWSAHNASTPDAVVAPLAELAPADWDDLWFRQYLWVHQDWSPAAEAPLRELAHHLVAEADPELSTITVRGARVDAVSWVFDAHDGTVEIVAETTERDTGSGVPDVAAGLARSLSLLAERGVRKAAIDGHLTDPHLGPVLGTFPPVPREPLDLVEIDPATAPARLVS
jgi:acetyltransferase (GNAT) family protein